MDASGTPPLPRGRPSASMEMHSALRRGALGFGEALAFMIRSEGVRANETGLHVCARACTRRRKRRAVMDALAPAPAGERDGPP